MGVIKKEKESFVKKAIKRKIKLILISIACFVLMVVSVIGVIDAVVQKMEALVDNLVYNVKSGVNVIAKLLGKDNWIDLYQEIEFEDSVTGEKKKQTIVDQYMQELSNLGVSLKSLKLLGDADYTDEEALQEKENKKQVQKYIEEFIRADIISQEIHKTEGTTNIESYQHENLVDGGIYVYRTVSETDYDKMNGTPFSDGTGEQNTVVYQGNIQYKRMKYKPYEEFVKYGEEINITKKRAEEIKNCFTINQEGLLLFYNTKIVETKTEVWKGETTNQEEITLSLAEPVDYKTMIAPYAMPYEFLINLCMVTENPEFVYHVAQLARETKINLMIQDNVVQTSTENVIEADANMYSKTVAIGNSKDSVDWSLSSSNRMKVYYKWKNVIEETSEALITRVNCWSYQLLYQYTNVITDETKVDGPKTVANRQYAEETEVHTHYTTGEVVSNTYKKFVAENGQQTITERKITNEYRPALIVGDVTGETNGLGQRKSRQFLGLLRNDTGQCPYNCFDQKSLAQDCAKEAIFNKNGKNVSYRIPNTQNYTEEPLIKLRSGEQLLYEYLQRDSKNVLGIEQEDGNKSTYNEKMQGLVEYIQYLLKFPQNEQSLTDEELDDMLDDYEEVEVDYDDITVDEDELEILYKICQAEAGGSTEVEIGHVASVILNRVKFSGFPNNIKDVVFQRKQFAPITNGSYDRAVPSEKTKRAVDTILANGDTTGGAIYFRTRASAEAAGMPLDKNTQSQGLIFLFEDPNTHVFHTTKAALEELKYENNYEDKINLTEKQKQLLDIVNQLVVNGINENTPGYCQKFVRLVFEKMGIYGQAGSATEASKKWKVSTDLSQIPIGATIYGTSSSKDGHVGIYIGNGKVISNIGNNHNCSYGGLKGIKCDDLNYWCRQYKYTCWGWQGGVPLN
ncbi:MAG: cell wall hydrolase [Clostridia bacterium]